MGEQEKVNILLVDDQPAKLLSYEAILGDLGESLIKVSSANEALELLLKTEIAVVLVDVCMPGFDGFELAAMIRDHPRFQKTAIIFVSAIHLSETDHLRGYQMGAVDYVSVPVVPEVLRAKVKVFAELFRKTRQLEAMNDELERRVVSRTAELEAYATRLLQSEQARTLALAAGQMGSWDYDLIRGKCAWDEGQYRIFGVSPESFEISHDNICKLIHPDDLERLKELAEKLANTPQSHQTEFRVRRPNGETRWCIGTVTASADANNRIVRLSGVTVDITDRKEAEERQALLAREVDHRAKNALAVVQSIIRLTRAGNIEDFVDAAEGRISALSRAHALLAQSRWQGAELRRLIDEELAPYQSADGQRIVTVGPNVLLEPSAAQAVALALHELATNAAKYGALSSTTGGIKLTWDLTPSCVVLEWIELGGPHVQRPTSSGFGIKVISASIEQHPNGQVKFDWRPGGLRCTLSLSSRIRAESQAQTPNPRVGEIDNRSIPQRIAGNRILLVEDEVLVGLMMRDILIELRFEVTGPVSTVSEAVEAARSGRFDAAVLDVNLRGKLVFPVADILASEGIPFVFVTGYEAASIDTRFQSAPIFKKPIELEHLRGAFIVERDDHNEFSATAVAG